MKQKQKDKLAENLPACAVEFIRLVINKMRYRREVRQDVQAELAGHFEDELKGCATDEEKAQKAQQLIAGFGNVKLLAVLLRRAKKRCRPLWRTVVARTFQTVGVLVVCFVIYVVWFLTGKPAITTNYVAELNNMVRPVADESLNAAPFYDNAITLYVEEPDIMRELVTNWPRDLNDEEMVAIENWINNNSACFKQIKLASEKPYYWQTYGGGGDWTDMMGIRMPNLNRFRNLARALLWRAHLHAEQGRYEDAFGDIKCCYRFGRHLRGDKSLIEQLVGIAIEALAAQTIRDILSEHRIDSPVLAELQQGFEKMIADEDCTVSFKFEKLSIYDEIQRSFTDGLGGGHIIPKHIAKLLPEVQIISSLSTGSGRVPTPRKQKVNWLSERISDIRDVVEDVAYQSKIIAAWAKKGGYVLFLHPDKYETREMADRCHAFWDKIVQKTPAQIRAENIDIEKQAMEIVEGNILLEIFTPAIGRVCEIAHRGKADIEAALTIIAILRYEQDTGGYPQNLEQLVADDYLKKLPIDPYSDEPLVYRRADDGFTLYSAGPNFIDDGGTIFYDDRGRPRWRGTTKGGDMVFWPVPKLQIKQ